LTRVVWEKVLKKGKKEKKRVREKKV